MREEIRALHEAVQREEGVVYSDRNRLRAMEHRLAAVRRTGDAGAGASARLEQEIAEIQQAIRGQRHTLADLRGKLVGRTGEFVLTKAPQQMAGELGDDLPILLLPVRLETRFMRVDGGRELWVRVFPDDIAVTTHEATLTHDEAVAGVAYWTEIHRLSELPEGEAKQGRRKAAWRMLAEPYGGPRAGWIVRQLERAIREKHPEFDLSFLEAPGEPDLILVGLGFHLDELKAESWSRAPRSTVMPDRFVLVGQLDGQRSEWVFPGVVPNPLIVGPNPQELENELLQRDGGLSTGSDFAWITEFDKAIEMGLGLRAPLPEPFASRGFDRLIVVGLRLSTGADDNAAVMEELIDNHHYSPDGMGFVAQGTPTNNTATRRSGFDRGDPGSEHSFTVENGPPLFSETDDDLEKSDAQRFAEAIGMAATPLAFLENAGNRDVAEAKAMNRALWPATLGYFLEELLEFDDPLIGNLRRFFFEHVQARGPLPALRVGNQPYGVLVTSAFAKWQVDRRVDGDLAAILSRLYPVLKQAEAQWQALSSQVRHVDSPGDPFANLLDILGLQATSASYAMRRAYSKSYLWNYAHFTGGQSFDLRQTGLFAAPTERYFQNLHAKSERLRDDLGFEPARRPRLFDLVFSNQSTPLPDPLVDDVERADQEAWSETEILPRRYRASANDNTPEPASPEEVNYIGWLLAGPFAALKEQVFRNAQDETLPPPRALLYRLLHRALLLANYDATMTLYEIHGLARSVRRELDFVNVEAGRTATRWEFMEASLSQVLPEVAEVDLPVAGFLNTPEGLQLPAAFTLAEVKASMGRLENLPTARLERLFAEHLDLCAYRLDAWQTGMFANRLAGLRRRTPQGESSGGVHLGAYGWLENLRPAPEAQPVDPQEIPESLREDGVPVFSQAGNAGHIHAPSINHAVAAAVLRNAYLTHADTARPEQFAVHLSSERMRTALHYLEGVRHGQELGALLGYQFERGLHDRHPVGGVAIEQFMLNFRKKYPLVADKITPAPGDDSVEKRETHHVLDGYALVEAAFLDANPLGYPYGVEGLPSEASPAGQAIRSEVERLAASLDAVGDLALAEGVYQVVQGNYDRAGAMLKALSEGSAPPEPEIAVTPRSGIAVHHKVALHLETGSTSSLWEGTPTPRAAAEPGLNRWLASILGAPAAIRVWVADTVDGDTRALALADLALQPIDLVLISGDAAGKGGLTELERRIEYLYRRIRRQADADWDASHGVEIRFTERQGFMPTDKTVFELLPLLNVLRRLVTTSRPLGAHDSRVPSEQPDSTPPGANPEAWNDEELRQRLVRIVDSFRLALDGLKDSIRTFPQGALDEPAGNPPDLDTIDFELLRQRLIRLADFGLPNAFPVQAVFPVAVVGTPAALELRRSQQGLIRQALSVADDGAARHLQAGTLANLEHLTPEAVARLTVAAKVDVYRTAARLVLGDAFSLLPLFSIGDPAEWRAAYDFGKSRRLTRHHAANAQIVEEWIQGVAAVRENVATFERIRGFHEAFNDGELPLVPVQLPHAESGYWVGVAYPDVSPAHLDRPDVFVPRGDFLSVTLVRPADYDPAGVQSGLLIDEWSERIPNRVETTGIAVHFDQPNTEPPQSLLLAVSPRVTGKWSWEDLVDVVGDTFDRARRRGVEPDHLTATPYAQVLPALITAVTSGSRYGTLSTPLVAAEFHANP